MLTRSALEAGTYEGGSFTLLQKRDHPADRLDAGLISKRFPAWAAGIYIDGYFNPQGGWAESGCVVDALATECRREGVNVHEGIKALELIRSSGRWFGVVTDQGDLSTGAVLLAMGAWTPGLLPELEGHIWPVAQPVCHFRVPEINVY
jgi:glycine/D-amino acid oxidase-like deaminating enzyme